MSSSTKSIGEFVKTLSNQKNVAAIYVEKESHPKHDLRRILSPKTTENGMISWYIPGVI